ncbi:MAG: sensor histidine kinase [Luteitalea sp.]
MARLPLLGSLYWRIGPASLALLIAALGVQTALLVFGVARGTGRPARQAAQRLAEVVAGDLGRELARRPRAPVTVGGQAVGRVVVLPGRPWTAVARDLGPWTLFGAGLCAIAAAALLAWLTFGPAHRRLTALESAATRLGRGDLSARAPEDGADEIARVSQAFNQTAGALAAQIQKVTAEQDVRRHLLADVSHELHTPLTTIRGYLETLRMRELPLTDADRERYLAIVDDEAVRLERLIGDLLDLARLDAGGQALHTQAVDVQALWTRLLDRHGPAAEAGGVRLIAGPSALQLTVDEGRIEQALSNLVANAIRFTPAGGEVRLQAHDLGSTTRLDVADTGAGITADARARVFDRFYKQDASRSTGGTGLGLSIVRAIAEAHGGTATAHSTPGAGSTFSITLPARASPTA